MPEEHATELPPDTLPEDPPVSADTIKNTPDALIGTVIDDRYQLESVIGDGGMGIVYAGRHVELGRPLAIKVLKKEIALSAASLRRFEREAQAATSLSHHHIITTLDFGRLPDGSPYMVMERLDGTPLDESLTPGIPMDTARAVKIARQLCDALDTAHEAGIIHRDLKPENVYLTQSKRHGDFVKVLDFGIAKVSGVTQLTQTGHIVGTPRYMAPEQCRGDAVDPRTDIYSLGVILYELVTGRLPFDGDLAGVIRMQLSVDPEPPSHHVSIPPTLEAVILRCLRKDPEERFSTALELDAALGAVEESLAAFVPSRALPAVTPPPGPSPTLVYALAAIAAVAIGGVVGWAFLGGDEAPGDDAETAVVDEAEPDPAPGAAEEGATTEPPATTRTAEPTLTEPRVTVETEPPGAEIFAGGILVGNAPVTLPRPTEALEIEARLRGHRPATVELDESSEERVEIALTKAGVAVGPRRRRRTPGMRPDPVETEAMDTPAPEPSPMMRRAGDGLGLLTPSSWDD